MSARVVVTDHAFGGVVRERAAAERAGAAFEEFHCTQEAETARAARGANVVFVNFAPITRAVLEGLAPGATVIRYGVGYDNVDLAAAKEVGVHVCNVPDYGVDTVADHTLALLLDVLRRVSMYDAQIREHGWIASGDIGPLPGFADMTVGLLGSGRIGSAVLARLRPFRFRLLVHDPYVDPRRLEELGAVAVDMHTLLTESSAVSLHMPLSTTTHHIVDADAIAKMPRGAVLVNTSRGGLIDETALAAALEAGSLAAAALDVVEHEPLPLDSPLRRTPNLVLTPHAAFYSDASLAALQRLAAEEAERALGGAPLRCEVTR